MKGSLCAGFIVCSLRVYLLELRFHVMSCQVHEFLCIDFMQWALK
jgi:hypothetical protein